MTKKIFRSIFFVSGIILLACTVTIMLVLYDYFTYIQRDRLKTQTQLVAHGLERDGVSYLDGLEIHDYRITLIAPDGTVLRDSEANAAAMENHVRREEIEEALQYGAGESERISSTFEKKTLYYAKRLSDGNVLRISVTTYSILTLLLGIAQPILLVILAALILSAILSKRLSKHIVEPLNRLNLEIPLENESYEEISLLLTRLEIQHRQIDSQMRELQRKHDEFSAVTENMNEGLILLGGSGTILSINSAAAELFGVIGDCTGQDIITVDRSVAMQEIIQKAYSGKHGETMMNFSGREYQVNASPVVFDGRAAGVCILAFDITEKAQAEQLRREFSANVSHELKTPLHTIMGSSELLENGLVKGEDIQRFAGNIRREASRLMTLIDDIIRLSQLDEESAPEHEEVNLKSLAQEVADVLTDEAKMKYILFEVRGEDILINGVRRLLYEIIYNLCDNALKYSNEGGKVEVLIFREDGKTVLEVKDTGIGIPAEHKMRVFERFYRVDKSHSKSTGGTGLGLSIVKHAAQYHHAEIQLDSEPGRGTSIKIIFSDKSDK